MVFISSLLQEAGVALSLLINKDVQQIVINDYDKAIYSFWRAITKETNAFISLIEQTPVNTETWKKQKQFMKMRR